MEKNKSYRESFLDVKATSRGMLKEFLDSNFRHEDDHAPVCSNNSFLRVFADEFLETCRGDRRADRSKENTALKVKIVP